VFIEIYNSKTGDISSHSLDEPVYEYITQLALYIDLLENENDYLEEQIKNPILDEDGNQRQLN